MKRLRLDEPGFVTMDRVTFLLIYNAAVNWGNQEKDNQVHMTMDELLSFQILSSALRGVQEEITGE